MPAHSGGVHDFNTAAQAQAVRLLRGHPEIRAKVLTGSLAPYAALVMAGRRKRYVRVPRGDVRAAVGALVKIFGRAAVEAALANVNESGVLTRPRSASSLVAEGRRSPLVPGGGAGSLPEATT